MSFRARWMDRAAADYEAIKQAALRTDQHHRSKSSKQLGLYKQVKKCIDLLLQDPRHPSLQTHEFSSAAHPFRPGDKVFEAYAQNKTPGAHRIFWCYGPSRDEITIIAITPHP